MTDPEKADEDDLWVEHNDKSSGDDYELWVEEEQSDDQPPTDEPAPDEDEMFYQMDVDEIDGEALWDELAAESESDAKTLDQD